MSRQRQIACKVDSISGSNVRATQQIQLIASHRGVGIGGYLVGALIEEAKVSQASLCLLVLKASPAVRLYERSGFVVTSESEKVFHMRAAAMRMP